MSSAASASTFVGSFWVGAGPYFLNNPPVYTGQEAAALIFGGVASDYWISVDPTVVTHTAWEDGYDDTSHLKTDWANSGSLGPVAEDFSESTGSGYLFGHPSFSAYVEDIEATHTTAESRDASINYVFLAEAGVPEPATWSMMILGFGLLGAALRRHRHAPAPIRQRLRPA